MRMRLELPLLALWLAVGVGLAALTTRVVAWVVMTDELLYERLAIGVDRLHSPLPHVHGELIPQVSQLYPLLLSTVYWHGLVPSSLRDAHVLDAFVMSSACIPAFLVARRVSGQRSAGYLAALLTVCVPWMVYSSLLLSEVAAYPAFLWCLLGLQRAIATPSRRSDVLALAGLALAILARTQFLVLVVVLPPALVAHQLALATTGRTRRVRTALRDTVDGHRLLAWAYALLVVAVLALLAAGRLSSVLGTYGDTLKGNLLPHGLARSFVEHLATIALALGILPFIVGVAWLLANLVRPRAEKELHAFAALGSVTVAALALEVTVFDLRFGGGYVRDRYLFYVAPVVLCAFACALWDRRWPRWSLLASTALAAVGFAVANLEPSPTFVVDAPVSTVTGYVLESSHSLTAARLLLVGATVLLTVLFFQGTILLRRSLLVVVLVLLALLALPAETGYTFGKLFDARDIAGRPITSERGGLLHWIDESVGTRAGVTMVPYPTIAGYRSLSIADWWDVEFWNKSVDRAAYYQDQFEATPSTFPKLSLRFDPSTGRANRSPTRYAALSAHETRFRISGNTRSLAKNLLLIDAGKRWRTDWLTFGLYDDGWTRPGVVARVRVFPYPGQREAVTRQVTLGFRAEHPYAVRSGAGVWRGRPARHGGTRFHAVRLCVPAHGYATVTIEAFGHSQIYGDMSDQATFAKPRQAGVFLTEIALADEIGNPCGARPK
jgi:hypothetical protein